MEYAKRTLKFYFKTLYEANGLKWTSDNDAEIEGIIEDIAANIKQTTLEEPQYVNAQTKDGEWYQFEQIERKLFNYPCKKCGNINVLAIKDCIPGFGQCKCGEPVPEFQFIVETYEKAEVDADKKIKKTPIEQAIEKEIEKGLDFRWK